MLIDYSWQKIIWNTGNWRWVGCTQGKPHPCCPIYLVWLILDTMIRDYALNNNQKGVKNWQWALFRVSSVEAVHSTSSSLARAHIRRESHPRKNRDPNQTTNHPMFELWEAIARRQPFDTTFPLRVCESVPGVVFYFRASLFGGCHHRWMRTTHRHAAAYEKAQLEVDSKHASPKLSHLVWFP